MKRCQRRGKCWKICVIIIINVASSCKGALVLSSFDCSNPEVSWRINVYWIDILEINLYVYPLKEQSNLSKVSVLKIKRYIYINKNKLIPNLKNEVYRMP